MLPKKHRLNQEEFDTVFSHGEKQSGSVGFLKIFKHDNNLRKLACTVPTDSSSDSVDRTRIRRRGYEAVEENWDSIPENTWVIWFLPYKAKDMPFNQLVNAFSDMVTKE